MHALLFALKRSHHACLRVTRSLLVPFRITPARLDMLKAIADCAFGLNQSDLRRSLGIARSTTSRMVRSLEEIGLVTRRRHFSERRQIHVEVSALGRALFEKVRRRLIDRDVPDLFIESVTASRWWNPLSEMDMLDAFLRRIRRTLGDNAKLHYPWHPDD